MKPIQTIKFFVFTFIIINFSSCTKDDINNNGEYAGISVSLKSESSELKNIFFEIEGVQVKVKEDGNLPNAWVNLNTINTGIHDVSDLRSESELLLVNHFEIKPTFIYEIRLVLGDNNFMNVNETLVSLDVAEMGNGTPSNIIKRAFESNHIYDMVIHVDIDKSISFNESENMMILNPKLYTEIRKF